MFEATSDIALLTVMNSCLSCPIFHHEKGHLPMCLDIREVIEIGRWPSLSSSSVSFYTYIYKSSIFAFCATRLVAIGKCVTKDVAPKALLHLRQALAFC